MAAVTLNVTWDPRELDKLFALYKQPAFTLKVEKALAKVMPALVGRLKVAERGSGIHNRSGEHLRSIKARRGQRRGGELAAYVVGPTDWKKYMLIEGHRVVTHRPALRDTGYRARAFPYVDSVIRMAEGQVIEVLRKEVWG